MSENNSFYDAIGLPSIGSEGTENTEPIVENHIEENQEQHTEEVPQEEVVNEVVAQEDLDKDTFFSTTVFEDDDEVSNQTDEPSNVEPTTVKDKVKYNLKDYVTSNEEVLEKYFKYKNLNSETMSQEQLLEFKLQKENPSWTKEDVKEELQYQYGLGLKKKEVTDDMSFEEEERVRQHNEKVDEQIRIGSRRMKSDAEKARRLLNEELSSLEFPEVELDVELQANPTKIIEEYQTKVQQEAQEFREKVWSPNVAEAVNKIGGFRNQYNLSVSKDSKEVIETTYKLTPDQKSTLKDYLDNYVSHPSDDKYLDEKGNIDFQRFVSDKAEQLFYKDIIKAQTTELVNKFKAKFLKEDVVNFQDEPRRVSTPTQKKDGIFAHWEAERAERDARYGKR